MIKLHIGLQKYIILFPPHDIIIKIVKLTINCLLIMLPYLHKTLLSGKN